GMGGNRGCAGALALWLAFGCAGERVTDPGAGGDAPGNEDPGGGAPGGRNAPVSLRVLGHGPVRERYTGEVAVRDGWAYTTTWGRRTAVGNAVKIWDVSDRKSVV